MSITSAIQGEGNGHMLKEDEFSRVLFECVTVCVVRMNVCVCACVCVRVRVCLLLEFCAFIRVVRALDS